MTMPDVSGLPTDLFATRDGAPNDPSVKEHHGHTDTVHKAVKALLPRSEAATDYATVQNLGLVSAAASDAQITADAAAASANAATRGDIVYVWGGTAYALAAGQIDNGTSPRAYRGGADGAPEAQAGHVARAGDWHLAVNP